MSSVGPSGPGLHSPTWFCAGSHVHRPLAWAPSPFAAQLSLAFGRHGQEMGVGVDGELGECRYSVPFLADPRQTSSTKATALLKALSTWGFV